MHVQVFKLRLAGRIQFCLRSNEKLHKSDFKPICDSNKASFKIHTSSDFVMWFLSVHRSAHIRGKRSKHCINKWGKYTKMQHIWGKCLQKGVYIAKAANNNVHFRRNSHYIASKFS